MSEKKEITTSGGQIDNGRKTSNTDIYLSAYSPETNQSNGVYTLASNILSPSVRSRVFGGISDFSLEPSTEQKVKSLQREIEEIKGVGGVGADVKKQLSQVLSQVQSIANEKNESIAVQVMNNIPSLLKDLSLNSRVAELEKLQQFFATEKFLWYCGFGHIVKEVNTVKQLHQIISDQTAGTFCSCKKGHRSALIVSGDQLMSLSMEDLVRNRIRGGLKKNKTTA